MTLHGDTDNVCYGWDEECDIIDESDYKMIVSNISSSKVVKLYIVNQWCFVMYVDLFYPSGIWVIMYIVMLLHHYSLYCTNIVSQDWGIIRLIHWGISVVLNGNMFVYQLLGTLP